MTANRYAAGTSVPVERSRAELDTLLGKHGATSRIIGMEDEPGKPRAALVGFKLGPHSFKLLVPLAGLNGFDKHMTKAAHARCNARDRERWRLIILLVKAKLEAIRLGVSTAEREFMPDLIIDGGRTLQEALAGGGMSRLLLPAGSSKMSLARDMAVDIAGYAAIAVLPVGAYVLAMRVVRPVRPLAAVLLIIGCALALAGMAPVWSDAIAFAEMAAGWALILAGAFASRA